MIRLLAFVGGLGGAVALSQFPEFSQQYLQRLGGQVDALSVVAADFDASAATAGMNRETALAALSGTEFLDARQQDMRTTFNRLERLSADLETLKQSGPLEWMLMPQRFTDTKLLQATWSAFQPAIPVTLTGLIAAGIGFVIAWGGVLGLSSVCSAIFMRRFTKPTA